MRIVIATGIFPPEVGGPATYAEQLGREFALAGHEVTVVTYATPGSGQSAYPFTLVRVVRGNKVLNRLRFFVRIVWAARGADVMYVFDWFAAGLPAAQAALLLRVPYIVRVGGDYLWEQRYLPSGAPPIPLRVFYEGGTYTRAYQGSIADRLIRFVLRRAAHVVFNSEIQRDLYVRFLGLPAGQVSTIWNPVPKMESLHIRRGEPTREFVFWGRLIVMKNLDTLLRAFARAKLPPGYSLAVIGSGPERDRLEELARELSIAERVSFAGALPQRAALERVKDARAFVLPSWTDIAPNQVAEALAVGIPCIVTSETFLPPSIRDAVPRFIDPASADDIEHALEAFADDTAYETLGARRKVASDVSSWDTVAQAYLSLGQSLRKI